MKLLLKFIIKIKQYLNYYLNTVIFILQIKKKSYNKQILMRLSKSPIPMRSQYYNSLASFPASVNGKLSPQSSYFIFSKFIKTVEY